MLEISACLIWACTRRQHLMMIFNCNWRVIVCVKGYVRFVIVSIMKWIFLPTRRDSLLFRSLVAENRLPFYWKPWTQPWCGIRSSVVSMDSCSNSCFASTEAEAKSHTQAFMMLFKASPFPLLYAVVYLTESFLKRASPLTKLSLLRKWALLDLFLWSRLPVPLWMLSSGAASLLSCWRDSFVQNCFLKPRRVTRTRSDNLYL